VQPAPRGLVAPRRRPAVRLAAGDRPLLDGHGSVVTRRAPGTPPSCTPAARGPGCTTRPRSSGPVGTADTGSAAVAAPHPPPPDAPTLGFW
jgi:hypothetical protein